jgi:BirA family biotin operon repressor/biotin-[acetyl-CoA-carboxylase] ligase
VAVAAAEACRAVSGAAVTIKWPNDLFHDGAKLGGVLAELRASPENGPELIVGTGINVELTHDDIPAELTGLITSLRLASGRRMLSREELAAGYLERLGEIAAALKRDNWDTIAGRWLGLTPAARGARVRIRTEPGSEVWCEGHTQGIDESGALCVRLADGSSVRATDSRSVVLVEE